jgi:large subunit ribosomal protein L29
MKAKELAKSSASDLASKRTELQKELIKLHAQVAMGTQIKNPGQIREIRRNIARIETELKTKERHTQG